MGDIIRDIMPELPSRRKLEKIRKEIAAYRRAIHNVKTADLQSIARQLGRKLDGKRGKEPQWISEFAGILGSPPRSLMPISIPNKIKGTSTRRSILTDLEADVDTLEVLTNDEEAEFE